MAIISFGDTRTDAVWRRKRVRGISAEVADLALRRLSMLHYAGTLADLRHPPSNRLEKIKSMPGWYSMRINSQWRLMFRWNDGAEQVQIIDYHR